MTPHEPIVPEISETAGNPDEALPCPVCDYDLRAQTRPLCPECGRAFGSLQELARASHAAHRVYERVLRWRVRIAWLIAASIVLTMGLLLPLFSFGSSRPARWFVVPALLCIPLASGGGFVLLLQVVFWRFDRRIARARRRELNGSIPLLLVFSAPFFLALVALLAIL